MKRFAFLFFTCWPVTAAVAQTLLTGAVRDKTGTPLPFASVALLNANDSTLAKGGLANELGIYTNTRRPARPVQGYG